MAQATGRKRFEFHKNNQSESITFAPSHFVSTHGLPAVHSRAQLLLSSSARSLSVGPLPSADDVLTQLKSELVASAAEIEAKADRRKALEAIVSRPKFVPPPPPDIRASKIQEEKQRQDAIRQRTYAQIQEEMRKKEEIVASAEKIRVQKANQREILEKEQRAERIEQVQTRAEKASEYRKCLEAQQNFPSRFGTEAWKDATATVSELGGLMEARYTKKHPKVVFTDPISFEYPRSPQAVAKESLRRDAARFFGETEQSIGKSRTLSAAALLSLAGNHREPVRDKHAGLNYRDTRNLLG